MTKKMKQEIFKRVKGMQNSKQVLIMNHRPIGIQRSDVIF